jgi:hypothetical protein
MKESASNRISQRGISVVFFQIDTGFEAACSISSSSTVAFSSPRL